MGCQALGSLRTKEAPFSPSQVRGASGKIKILSFTSRSVYLFIFTEGVDILEFPALVDYSEIQVYLSSQKTSHTSLFGHKLSEVQDLSTGCKSEMQQSAI